LLNITNNQARVEIPLNPPFVKGGWGDLPPQFRLSASLGAYQGSVTG
jgi:hypothetical protein